jgi:serine/threonine-protein kinase RsbW
MKTAHSANIKPARKPKLGGPGARSFSVTIEAWMPSEIDAISPLIDQLMRLIEGLCCVVGGEFAVELALREALNNAVVHGNAMDPHKLVKVRCRCESGKGVWLAVRDQGKGFDPSEVSDPLERNSMKAEQGRGIYLMKWAMDQVVFKVGGAEVCMWKAAAHGGRPEAANQAATGRPHPNQGT